MKIIVISGTPGTGKTSVSRKITKTYNAKIISLNEVALSKNFKFLYDRKRDTRVVDTDEFLPYIIRLIKKIKEEVPDFLIVEGHFSDILPEKYIDYALIFRCDPDILTARLKERQYSIEKVIENIQSEILGNCANYFIQKNMKIPLYEIDTTHYSIENVAEIIMKKIVINNSADTFLIGKIDWLEKVFQEDRIDDFFNEEIKF